MSTLIKCQYAKSLRWWTSLTLLNPTIADIATDIINTKDASSSKAPVYIGSAPQSSKAVKLKAKVEH